MTNQIKREVPEGYVLLQRENGKPKYAACMVGRFAGWLMWKHPDGHWVSERKLESWEVMQAEDQRDYGIVHETIAATQSQSQSALDEPGLSMLRKAMGVSTGMSAGPLMALAAARINKSSAQPVNDDDRRDAELRWLVFNIGCIECGVSSAVVGRYATKEEADVVAQACNKELSWREGGQNAFEVFDLNEMPSEEYVAAIQAEKGGSHE